MNGWLACVLSQHLWLSLPREELEAAAPSMILPVVQVVVVDPQGIPRYLFTVARNNNSNQINNK